MLSFAILTLLGAFASSEGSVGLVPLSADVAITVLKLASPGVDFPILDEVPKTGFTCLRADIVPGHYYADAETGCQVFHLCDKTEILGSYLCPNYTIFNDQTEVCEWFHQVDCTGKGKPIVISKPLTISTETSQTIGSGILSTSGGSGWGSSQNLAPQVILPAVVPIAVTKPVVNTNLVTVAKPQFNTQEIPKSPLVAINAFRVSGFPNVDSSLVSGIRVPLPGTSQWKTNMLRPAASYESSGAAQVQQSEETGFVAPALVTPTFVTPVVYRGWGN